MKDAQSTPPLRIAPKSAAAAGLPRDLDAIAASAGATLARSLRARTFGRALQGSIPLIGLVPLFHLIVQIAQWNGGGSSRLLPVFAVVGLAATIPLVFAWFSGRDALQRPTERGAVLGEVDHHLGLEGRLQTADEFLSRRGRSGFEEAAIEDAATRSAAARAAELAIDTPSFRVDRRVGIWAGIGLACVLTSAWVGTQDPKSGQGARRKGDVDVAAAGTPQDAEVGVEEAARSPELAPELPAPAPKADERRSSNSPPEKAEASSDLSENVKESSGKTGSGRSSGALSSSAGSESRSAPSTQGQTSKPAEREPKAKPPTKKKPKPTDEQPPPEERPEDEESGSTAGKGSSKGSNKNPTASDWKSKDQVTETDDQEIEDDEETDDDEEEQENRGGVQPSLRDRRPPVSRDLQIGFGNRPNPDANGRGGPSEQKKSRGVASLVLGVPVPDRIKGRPGPGPTKITQERIEPQAEEPTGATASARRSRQGSLGEVSTIDVDPGLVGLVRRYFLARRQVVAPQ